MPLRTARAASISTRAIPRRKFPQQEIKLAEGQINLGQWNRQQTLIGSQATGLLEFFFGGNRLTNFEIQTTQQNAGRKMVLIGLQCVLQLDNRRLEHTLVMVTHCAFIIR